MADSVLLMNIDVIADMAPNTGDVPKSILGGNAACKLRMMSLTLPVIERSARPVF